ncbi:MAG: GNAT family N-acetyltransferase [Phycisphaeraceae bacterium]|nr:GNAT family N-acetyltransferase [Phycisphaerales bacterium]MCB9860208.1 GNAT family N-acetyltransferase [Phycisphaeraceae bacterium]
MPAEENRHLLSQDVDQHINTDAVCAPSIGATGLHTQIEAKPRVSGPRAAIMRIDCPTQMPWQATLFTQRLQLRTLAETDRSQFIELIRTNTDHLAVFSPVLHENESLSAMFERQLALTLQGMKTGRGMRRVIALPDNTIVGVVMFNRIERGMDNFAEISFWIGHQYTRNGYALEAVRAMTAFALTSLPSGLGVDTVRAFVQIENTASATMMAKVGYTHKSRQTPVMTGSEYILHDEWEIEVTLSHIQLQSG